MKLGHVFASLIISCSLNLEAGPLSFSQPDARRLPDLFVWTDTCNVYVLRQGEDALLIDLGDGSVLQRLKDIGVKRVSWVLFTHHHREQCQGSPRLAEWQPKIAGPESERALFEQPANFRKMQVRLGDAYTIHGSSYVRPPIQPIHLDRPFKSMDTFEWGKYSFWCVQTRGNSPGSLSYMLRVGPEWIGFTGDLMLDGARMHTWYDTEWDYGFGAGIWALCNSAAQVAGYRPASLFPSHGPAIRNPGDQLLEYERKLRNLERLLVRGYPVSSFSGTVQDRVSRPAAVPHLWQVSPHIFKFRGPDFFPNFYLILADSGHALVVDCGLLDTRFLNDALEAMQSTLGLKHIDAQIITHMHGDHLLQAPWLREKWGAPIWALDRMGQVCEHPERFDYAAAAQAYGAGFDGVKFDRLFRSGESFAWEGYRFTVDWMPGQTKFALCLHGRIDGKLVAFTGDNLFGDTDDPAETGHEAMVAHNSAILEEGYIYAGTYLKQLKPDMLLGGHSYVMDQPAKFIKRFARWGYEMREAFQDLSSAPDYRFWFDPFWVRADPYRSKLRSGEQVEIGLHLRNFLRKPALYRIALATPAQISAEPALIEAQLGPEEKRVVQFRVKANEGCQAGVNLLGFDVSLNGERFGQLFDCVLETAREP